MLSRFRLIALTPLVILASAQAAKLPGFQDYRVSNIYRGKVKPPHFGDPAWYSGTDLRCFGDPTQYAGERVNFAGHFVIGACTCGRATVGAGITAGMGGNSSWCIGSNLACR